MTDFDQESYAQGFDYGYDMARVWVYTVTWEMVERAAIAEWARRKNAYAQAVEDFNLTYDPYRFRKTWHLTSGRTKNEIRLHVETILREALEVPDSRPWVGKRSAAW